ncbi:hypothetical protein SRB5_48320 [Streptomyces sp. RB5]|uniref:Uncharacterized protein n=1 Tax=Streptomyces smaragdinus TaxID=2585196 RepID=A0A7K0CMF4_9ACTN|nr:hypothetical protein [Streptomyces smaragdinus]MQY14656.1 hypothetical protein [Streptomyces smaragdinus]
MDVVSALVPPTVMAIFFVFLIMRIVKSQGGPNKAKEDAILDQAEAAAAQAAALRQKSSDT